MPPRRPCSATSFLPGFEPVYDGPHAARFAGRQPVRTELHGLQMVPTPVEPPAPLEIPSEHPAEPVSAPPPPAPNHAAQVEARRGPKQAARDILAAIRTLKTLEAESRDATPEECTTLARFGGFGPVAKEIFPDPRTRQYKPGWREIGEELKDLLSPEEYESAKRTTFSQFFTSPLVMDAMHDALEGLGVLKGSVVLEPGCGKGAFMDRPGYRYIGVELDGLSGRIAKALHPEADVRIESFADSRLPPVDAVIGNVPFADVKLDYHGRKLSLHDFFIMKSVDALKPGGVLALVTSHYTLDKQNAGMRIELSEKADFLGAIRLPCDAFKTEGTEVTTDVVFLRKRAPGQEPRHADPEWLETTILGIDKADLSVNRYFANHHEQVLGDWSRKDTLYGSGFSVLPVGDLGSQLKAAVGRIVSGARQSEAERPNPPPARSFAAESQVERAESQVERAENQVAPRFTPSLRHVTEGSFFVADDKVIHQVEDGQANPVTYGGTLLRADGTMTGRRMASLIGLRDHARRVLQSQNEGWPERAREAARADLNRAYDRFASQYGPINKTTISEGKDGPIRRMPNLAKFREDPDAMLVMALEEYDETTGKAAKADVMKRDVVGKTPDVTHVRSAEEGLLVSLDRKGAVDLPYIAGLYGKPESEVISELGDLIYRDPALTEWQTADTYLSGDVRSKLRDAEAAGPEYARNAVALRSVQPEDVLPGDIDAGLGAPWIPASDIRAFACELFGVADSAITIGHLKKDAVWSVDAGYAAEASVAATSDYGTGRANGVSLFEQALNMKSPVIYDTIRGVHGEERVLNQVETLAAKEKQRAIKERFKSWVFSDPERTERLVRIYNDTYNNLRPRLFDGSHLDFPGMNRNIELRPHQEDAVWRVMSGGNTLLAHAVGAGKTNCCVASALKMKQAGLVKKPMFVVMNHMLEQFAREAQQLYPNAKFLIATKDDFTRERRKMLTAKIASGDWDGIIVTHSGFERIGMSRDYQERFLREQIADYESLLLDAKGSSTSRNIIKTLEKQKANHQERLKGLMAGEKKDDGLVFDELGVDHLFIDESAASFKNLSTPTKMDRVAGIQTGGSERAFDLYMKCRYLDEKHPGHGVTFATGTPISNTMVEMYTNQRFLDPHGLRSRGIEHFDAWAATFGEVVDAMEISPDGKSLKSRSRFARFNNLPELQTMFRSFADVQTAEMLNLPRPRLAGGKPQVIACPMSAEQAEIQASLVGRYEKLRTEKVDPRVDNALAITTDGRKLALEARLLDPNAPDFEGSKVNALAANVERIWRETEPTRGTQMVFCDMGVHPTPAGYSVYHDVTDKLVARGIPRSQIASIGDADTDAKKQALFEKVRQGTVRVLLGSTQKMGTGTNAQKRLVALHHLDAPWKPAEVEQRDGRILRQGNTNEEVAIYRYVTEGSFDAYMWQTLETKARFINQVMTGESAVRRAEDVGGQELSYAEVKAIASGNPAVLTLAEADAELQRLAILKKNHADEQFLGRRAVRELPEQIRRMQDRIAALSEDMGTAEKHAGDPVTVGERALSREDALAALGKRLDSISPEVRQTRRVRLGEYRGLEFGLVLHTVGSPEAYLSGKTTRTTNISREAGPRAVLNALGRIIDDYEVGVGKAKQDLGVAETQLRDYEARLGRPFQHEAYMRELAGLRDELRAGLSGIVEEGKEPVDTTGVAERIKALRAENAVEGAVERVKSERRVSAEVPVTRRIKRDRVEETEGLVPEAKAEPIVVPAAVAVQIEPVFAKRVERGPTTQGRWF